MAEFIVVGAAHWDVIGLAPQLAPGRDVPGRVMRRPGGVALNIALALARAGRTASLVSVIGKDRPGRELASALRSAGVGTPGLIRRGVTGCCLTLETNGDLFGAVADCSGLDDAGTLVLDRMPRRGQVIADGNLALDVLQGLLPRRPVLVAASPAKAARIGPLLKIGRASVSANLAEAQAMTGRSQADSARAVESLLGMGASWAVVTDGPRAAALGDEAGITSLTPPAAPGGATGGATGAGDAFLAHLLIARAEARRGQTALDEALAAAARHRAETAHDPAA